MNEQPGMTMHNNLQSKRDPRKTFVLFLYGVVIIGLAVVAAFLMSEINSRKYQIRSFAGQLIVERGQFLPLGFGPYEPEADDLRLAYAPFPLPAPDMVVEPRQFGERTELSQGLYELVATWSRSMLQFNDPSSRQRASELIARCELLPGLSVQQRTELQVMQGDVTLGNGHSMVNQASELLRVALATFHQAKQLGTSNPDDVDLWISEIEQRMDAGRERAERPEYSPLDLNGEPAAVETATSGQVKKPQIAAANPSAEPLASAPSNDRPVEPTPMAEPSNLEPTSPDRTWGSPPPGEGSRSGQQVPNASGEGGLDIPARASGSRDVQDVVL